MKELYDSLRPKEARMFRWSAAAAAAALWFSIAWRDAWVLLLVPMIAAWFVFLVRRNRKLDPFGDNAPEESLRRRRAEADEHARLQHRDLGVEPRPASRDLAPVRLLVDATLPLRLPLEVLHD